jgi:transcriptional regulator
MYLPAHFAETRQDVLLSLIESHRLATIVRVGPDGLVADHIPLIIHQRENPVTLRGHVARANPLWREADGADVLVIFQGPQAYVSPGWYASKAEHGKVVPTWNYAVVHASGRLAAIDDTSWLHGHASEMTDANEAKFAEPWKVSDAPAPYIEATARAIVGIEITVSKLTGKWKVSQNRSTADRAGVAQGLRAHGNANDMAELVAPPDETK